MRWGARDTAALMLPGSFSSPGQQWGSADWFTARLQLGSSLGPRESPVAVNPDTPAYTSFTCVAVHLVPGTTIMARVLAGGSRVKRYRRNLWMWEIWKKWPPRNSRNKLLRRQATLPQNVDGTIQWKCLKERSRRCLEVMACTVGEILSAIELYVEEILKMKDGSRFPLADEK